MKDSKGQPYLKKFERDRNRIILRIVLGLLFALVGIGFCLYQLYAANIVWLVQQLSILQILIGAIISIGGILFMFRNTKALKMALLWIRMEKNERRVQSESERRKKQGLKLMIFGLATFVTGIAVTYNWLFVSIDYTFGGFLLLSIGFYLTRKGYEKFYWDRTLEKLGKEITRK